MNFTNGSMVNDGPACFYKSFNNYIKYSEIQANKLNMTVSNFGIEDDIEETETRKLMNLYHVFYKKQNSRRN